MDWTTSNRWGRAPAVTCYHSHNLIGCSVLLIKRLCSKSITASGEKVCVPAWERVFVCILFPFISLDFISPPFCVIFVCMTIDYLQQEK